MAEDFIALSAPHLGDLEFQFVREAFDTNWVGPLGPHVDGFEKEICELTGAGHALALSSGTAAIHLALQVAGIGRGDTVLASTFTFAASVNPIRYLGAQPIFIDSERHSWNMDPQLLDEALAELSAAGKRPAAVLLVHLYGQAADLDGILAACAKYSVPLIEDAAEAMGSSYKGKYPGTFGLVGTLSFNGNKIITTGGGGMLITDSAPLATHARKLSTQARDPAPYYQHSEIGYNYRLSNVLAGIGRGQLKVLEDRVQARRRNFAFYLRELSGLRGLTFMPEASWGRHTRWMSNILIDPNGSGITADEVRVGLSARQIEARPLWKPMHLQPVFRDCKAFGGGVSEDLFSKGLSIPSSSFLSDEQLHRVVEAIQEMWPAKS